MNRHRISEWGEQSDGIGARPWFVRRGKPDGTMECSLTSSGKLRRFKSWWAAARYATALNLTEDCRRKTA